MLDLLESPSYVFFPVLSFYQISLPCSVILIQQWRANIMLIFSKSVSHLRTMYNQMIVFILETLSVK